MLLDLPQTVQVQQRYVREVQRVYQDHRQVVAGVKMEVVVSVVQPIVLVVLAVMKV